MMIDCGGDLPLLLLLFGHKQQPEAVGALFIFPFERYKTHKLHRPPFFLLGLWFLYASSTAENRFNTELKALGEILIKSVQI